MNVLGYHFLMELKDCKKEILNNVDFIRTTMERAAVYADATVVNTVFHKFSPHGVTGIVVIAESHLAIHTWPEYDYAAVDVFTCGDREMCLKAIQYLEEAFEAEQSTIQEVQRGKFSETEIFEKGREITYLNT